MSSQQLPLLHLRTSQPRGCGVRLAVTDGERCLAGKDVAASARLAHQHFACAEGIAFLDGAFLDGTGIVELLTRGRQFGLRGAVGADRLYEQHTQ